MRLMQEDATPKSGLAWKGKMIKLESNVSPIAYKAYPGQTVQSNPPNNAFKQFTWTSHWSLTIDSL
eukprot:1246044-Amphidinium_carterae.1